MKRVVTSIQIRYRICAMNVVLIIHARTLARSVLSITRMLQDIRRNVALESSHAERPEWCVSVSKVCQRNSAQYGSMTRRGWMRLYGLPRRNKRTAGVVG